MGIIQKNGFLWIIGMLLIVSCERRKPDSAVGSPGPQYMLSLSSPSLGSYPFDIVSDLESGVAQISDAYSIPGLPNSIMVTSRPGFVFLNSREKLTKYSVNEHQVLTEEGHVQNTGLLGGPISAFLDDNRLLISTAPRQVPDSLFAYQVINTSDMTEELNGKLSLPISANSVASPSMYIVKEGKVLVPFIHADAQNHAYPKAGIAIFNAENMAYEKTIYTNKTACLGYSVVSSHAVSENGDLYLVSSNSNYWGANESLPSGIVKIRAGQTDFDSTYFINLTAALKGNHSGGLIYAGANKAIVQIFESSLIKAYSDYQNGFVISYYEVDLVTHALRKLDIPLSKYPRRAMLRLKNGKVAIAINAESGENAFYIYQAGNGSVKKGLVYKNAEYLSGLMAF